LIELMRAPTLRANQMQKPEQLSAALAICAALWSIPSVSAQCQAPDGTWHDYTSPMCQPPKQPSTPKATDEPPWYFEPGIKFGDLDEIWAMMLRGQILRLGLRLPA
jgi:hypothetical protein